MRWPSFLCLTQLDSSSKEAIRSRIQDLTIQFTIQGNCVPS